MVLKFFLSFDYPNLASLTSEKRQKVLEKTGLTYIKVLKIFWYKKNNDGYWNRAKLYQQVVNKALPIVKAFFPKYSLLFLFDNTTIYLIYAKNAL